MNKPRPKNLDIASMKLPLTAIASICHRISGLILFLIIPLLLWWLQLSLSSSSFATLVAYMQLPLVRAIVWVILVAMIYHLMAGVKHLLMDIGFFETKESGRLLSIFLLGSAVIVALVLGVLLWP